MGNDLDPNQLTRVGAVTVTGLRPQLSEPKDLK